jgi:hypothetical protein
MLNSLLAGLGYELKRLGSRHRCYRTHQQSGHVRRAGIVHDPRAHDQRLRVQVVADGRRKTTTRPDRELERAMVVQRAPCIRVVEGEASVAPLDHARSPVPICPHRIAMYQVRSDHSP